MTPTEVQDRLGRLLTKEGLKDPHWVMSLSEFDEPPLFARSQDVEFLAELPAAQRGPAVVRWAVEVLSQVCETVAESAIASRYFVCVTLMDWDLFNDGAQTVPTPSLLVSPNVVVDLPDFRLHAPTSMVARLVADWLEQVDHSDLCVGEAMERQIDEPFRVYLGYGSKMPFKSIGDFL